MLGWNVIGIDPAPTKPAVVCRHGSWEQVKPPAIRQFILDAAKDPAPTLIAWDAPLSYDRADHFDRKVDKVARAWAKQHVLLGHFEDKAINAMPFAGLPHWAITCDALGLPFGRSPAGMRLVHELPVDGHRLVAIEVHPAVALGAWWIMADCDEPLPRYKGKPDACRLIAEVLDFPTECGENDDALDAFIACQLGELFLDGKACCVGDSSVGGYVMPKCAATDEMLDGFAAR